MTDKRKRSKKYNFGKSPVDEMINTITEFEMKKTLEKWHKKRALLEDISELESVELIDDAERFGAWMEEMTKCIT